MDENDVEIWNAWEQLLGLPGADVPVGSARDDLLPILAKMRKPVLTLSYNIGKFCGGRHFCVTESGSSGLCHRAQQKKTRFAGLWKFILRLF